MTRSHSKHSKYRSIRWSAAGVILFSAFTFWADSLVQAQSPATATASQKDEARDAKKKKESTRYLRLVKDESKKPVALQTAITRFRKKDSDVIVDLIAAVHIGEGQYGQ